MEAQHPPGHQDHLALLSRLHVLRQDQEPLLALEPRPRRCFIQERPLRRHKLTADLTAVPLAVRQPGLAHVLPPLSVVPLSKLCVR